MNRRTKIALGIGIFGVLLLLYLGVAAVIVSGEGITRVNLLIGIRSPGEIMRLTNFVLAGNLIIWGIWTYYYIGEDGK